MNYSLHNIAEHTLNSDGSLNLHRFPLDVTNSMETDLGKENAKNILCSSELRFVIGSGEAEITVEYAGDELYSPKVFLYFGSFQGALGWESSLTLHKGINTFRIVYPYSIDSLIELQAKNSFPFSPKVVRLFLPSAVKIIKVKGDIRSPLPNELPDKKIVFYGSSITAGGNSLDETSSYPLICGRLLGADILNKGMPGSCFLEKEAVDFVFNHDADLYLVELGTNCYQRDKNEWFKERVVNVLSTHQRLCPNKPLIVIDLFRLVKEPCCCKIVKDAVALLNRDNIIYISGDSILDDVKYYSCDLVHPSADAHHIIAEKICRLITAKGLI